MHYPNKGWTELKPSAACLWVCTGRKWYIWWGRVCDHLPPHPSWVYTERMTTTIIISVAQRPDRWAHIHLSISKSNLYLGPFCAHGKYLIYSNTLAFTYWRWVAGHGFTGQGSSQAVGPGVPAIEPPLFSACDARWALSGDNFVASLCKNHRRPSTRMRGPWRPSCHEDSW